MRLCLLLVLIGTAVQAQPRLVARASLGLDQHGDVGGLGEWQDSERLQISARGIEASVTDDFPAYGSIEGALGVDLGSIELGILAGTSSTGGRLAYADYSGSLVVERIARRTFFGLYGEGLPVEAGPVRLGAGLAARLSRTTVRYQRDLIVGDLKVETADIEMTGSPVSVEPMFLGEATVVGPIHARVRTGWELSSTSELNVGDLPPDARQASPTVGWSGLRASIGLAIRVGQ